MRVPASMVWMTLRIRWLVPVVLLVIGAVAGFATASRSPYAASATLLVDTSTGGDTAAQSQIVQTALQMVDTEAVYDQAARTAGVAGGSLSGKTAISVVPSTTLLSIRVTDPDPGVAAREADGLASAAVRTVSGVGRSAFSAAEQSGEQSLSSGSLRDQLAENARRQAIGTTTAQRQDQALRAESLVTRIGDVGSAQRVGLSPALGLIVGAFLGLLLGCAGALVIGVRRSSIRRASDLDALPFEVSAFDPAERELAIIRAAARCSAVDRPLIVVLGLPGTGNAAVTAVADDLTAELKRWDLRSVAATIDSLVETDMAATNGVGTHDGGVVSAVDRADAPVDGGMLVGAAQTPTAQTPTAQTAVAQTPAAQTAVAQTRTLRPSPRPRPAPPPPVPERPVSTPALTKPRLRAALSASGADVYVITGTAHPAVLHRLANRVDVAVLVGQQRRTSIGLVVDAAETLASHQPVIVLTSSR